LKEIVKASTSGDVAPGAQNWCCGKSTLEKVPQNERKSQLTDFELQASKYVTYVSQYTAKPVSYT